MPNLLRNRRPLLGAIAAFLAAFLLLSSAVADTVTVSWTTPTTYIDGTPLPADEIAGYRIAWTWRGEPRADLTAPPGDSFEFDYGTLAGKVCVTLFTVTIEGIESDPAEERCRTARPGLPTNIRIR